jgi:hypothetical protein
MTEEEVDGIDWERFAKDKLYRALVTERGLPPPLPEEFFLDVPRLRSDLAYSTMVHTRGLTVKPDPAYDAEIERLWRERRGLPPEGGYDHRPAKVVSISDPRFRVRREPSLSALRR